MALETKVWAYCDKIYLNSNTSNFTTKLDNLRWIHVGNFLWRLFCPYKFAWPRIELVTKTATSIYLVFCLNPLLFSQYSNSIMYIFTDIKWRQPPNWRQQKNEDNSSNGRGGVIKNNRKIWNNVNYWVGGRVGKQNSCHAFFRGGVP